MSDNIVHVMTRIKYLYAHYIIEFFANPTVKTYFLLAFIGIEMGLAMLIGCDTKTQQRTEQTTPADQPIANNLTDSAPASNQSELLKKIIGTPGQGLFRGINFGDNISKVRSMERFEMFEDTPTHVGFTHETENLESVDVLYYFDKNNRVNGVSVDVFLNSEKSVKELMYQFETYLSGKFGASTRSKNTLDWTTAKTLVRLQNASQGRDFGIKLIFTNQSANSVLFAQFYAKDSVQNQPFPAVAAAGLAR